MGLVANEAINAIKALGKSMGETAGAGFTFAGRALESGSFSGASDVAREIFLKNPTRLAKNATKAEIEAFEKANLGWSAENINKGKFAAAAATGWVAGNAGVGMIKGVFTDRNGNFDMPLVPGI